MHIDDGIIERIFLEGNTCLKASVALYLYI